MLYYIVLEHTYVFHKREFMSNKNGFILGYQCIQIFIIVVNYNDNLG